MAVVVDVHAHVLRVLGLLFAFTYDLSCYFNEFSYMNINVGVCGCGCVCDGKTYVVVLLFLVKLNLCGNSIFVSV